MENRSGKIHIRKQRLVEALSQPLIPANAQIPRHVTMDVISISSDESVQPSPKRRRINAENERLENKLQLLERWEITKRNAIERLASEMEALENMEKEIQQREGELAEKGFLVDKDIYNAHFIRQHKEQKRKQRQNNNEPTSSSAAPVVRAPTTPTLPRRALVALAHSTPNSLPGSSTRGLKVFGVKDENTVVIGPNGTTVPRAALNTIKWSLTGAAIARKILVAVFGREVLAFHTLTGKPSPAFMDIVKPAKHRLDPAKVDDVIYIVTENTNMTPKEVRNAITTKCADENKMFRQREKKRLEAERKAGLLNRANTTV